MGLIISVPQKQSTGFHRPNMHSIAYTLLGTFLALFIPNLETLAQANKGYDSYANQLFKNLPHNARIRPDLEVYLSGLASNARKHAGKPGLKHSKLVSKAARAQAAEMVLGNFVGHNSKGGYSFQDRLKPYTDHRNSYWAENAARDRLPGPADKKKAKRLFNMWMSSAGHRRNLMRTSFSYVSTGVIQMGNTIYAIQIFWEK